MSAAHLECHGAVTVSVDILEELLVGHQPPGGIGVTGLAPPVMTGSRYCQELQGIARYCKVLPRGGRSPVGWAYTVRCRPGLRCTL